MRGRKVIEFRRGARRHPKWDMGTPPGSPRRPRPVRDPLSALLKGLLGLTVVVGILPPVLDVVNGFVKPAHGCRVVQVVDGDTVKMICPRSGYVSGRLLGFDTPELFSPQCASEWGRAVAATFYLRWRLYRAGTIIARPQGTDLYGRWLTQLTLDGVGADRLLIRAGLARAYDGGKREGWCT